MIAQLLLLVTSLAAVSAEWGYEGSSELPANWGDDFPTCDGKRQSPIDINCRDSWFMDLEGPRITVQYEGESGVIVNNAHSAQWSPGSGRVTLEGPLLDGTYVMAQAHFHWGRKRNEGSEHALYGLKASMEMHLVFYQSKYNSFNEAVQANEYQGISVVAVLFEETARENPFLDPLVETLTSVREVNSTVQSPFLDFSKIYTGSVFEYEGSLTTPPCSEIVYWYVLPQLHTVSHRQIALFRSLSFEDENLMVNNFRPLQDLNDRLVLRNEQNCKIKIVNED